MGQDDGETLNGGNPCDASWEMSWSLWSEWKGHDFPEGGKVSESGMFRDFRETQQGAHTADKSWRVERRPRPDKERTG